MGVPAGKGVGMKLAHLAAGDAEALVRDLADATEAIIAAITAEEEEWRKDSFIEALRIVRNVRMAIELAIHQGEFFAKREARS